MRLGRASAYGMIAMMDIAKAGPRSPNSSKNGKSHPPPAPAARSGNGHAHRNGGNGHGHGAATTATAATTAPQSRARQIAEDTGIPVEYLRKVLQRLTRARLVQSERGR